MAGGCEGVGASSAGYNAGLSAGGGGFGDLLAMAQAEGFKPGTRRGGGAQDVGVASPEALAEYAQRNSDGSWSLFDGAMNVSGSDAEETVNEILWAYEQDPVTKSDLDTFAAEGRSLNIVAEEEGRGSRIENYNGATPTIYMFENDDKVSRYGFDAEIVLHEIGHATSREGHEGAGQIGNHEIEMAQLAYRLGFNPDKIIVPYD